MGATLKKCGAYVGFVSIPAETRTRWGYAVLCGESESSHAIPATAPLETCWVNPFKAPRDGTLAEVLVLYEQHVRSKPELLARLHELAGLELACWCAPAPCHGDVLVRLFDEFARAQSTTRFPS